MKQKNNKEITVSYIMGKEDNTEFFNDEVENNNFKNKIANCFTRLFKRKNENFSSQNEEVSNDDNSDLVDEIASDGEVQNIKKNIGGDHVLEDICNDNIYKFKQNLLRLKNIPIEDQFFMVDFLNKQSLSLSDIELEENYEKIKFLIDLDERVLSLNDHYILKSINLLHLKKLNKVLVFKKISYKINNDFIYDNKKAVFLFENGLLDNSSDIDLELFPVEDIKRLATKYGEDYTLPFLEKKFKQTSFMTMSIIKVLIELGMNVNTLDDLGRNSLWFIKNNDDLDYLKEKGIKINTLDKNSENYLFEFVRNSLIFDYEQKEVFENSLKYNLNMNIINNKGENVLFEISRKFNNAINDVLSMNAINPYQRNLKGENILFFIDDFVLLKNIAEKYRLDLFILNNNNESLLFGSDLNLITELINYGLDSKHKNNQGKTYLLLDE